MTEPPHESDLPEQDQPEEVEPSEQESAPGEEPESRRRLPRFLYNPISLTGAALAVAMLVAIVIVFIVDATSQAPSPYIGILGFAVLPIPLIIGLLLIPFGMWLEYRREKRAVPAMRVPTLDLNKPQHRLAFFIFVSGSMILLFLSAGGFYKAFEYTESVAFCGTVCHEVMEPEHTTYLVSPHARVKCVECHIGEGAEWFVRSKLSGAYQVYSVIFNKYPQPIPTPIENLRPARDTCEHCHWPTKFHGNQMWEVSRYLSDEENTLWTIRMMMKTGGADETSGQIRGIHWHIAQKVEYIASDSTRRDIREVRHHLPDGSVEIYRSMYNPLEEDELEAIAPEEIRTMDCMDCHNRPSHQYLSPRHAMDEGFETGAIPKDLPYIKRQGANLLAAEYPAREEGMEAIENGIRDYYSQNYPEIAVSRATDISGAVRGIQQIYSTYFFPYMKAMWSAYPSHIGHQEFPGCFRCHNGAMASDSGAIIRNDCSLCHSIVAQGPGVLGFETSGAEGVEFRHPEDIGEAWRMMACTDCHTGGEYY